MAQEVEARNRKSARQLVVENNAGLNLMKNPQTGKMFFTCGTTSGYVSPKAAAKFNEPDAKLSDFQYAEVSIKGGEFVPCLMIVGAVNPDNVIKTLGSELTR